MKTVQMLSEGKLFQTRGAATPKTRSPTVFSLERRTTSLLTQIGVAYVSHRQLSTASLSPGILMPCYCGSGTQERPDGTQYVLGCAASAGHAADVKYGRIFGRCTPILLPHQALTADDPASVEIVR